MTSRPPCSRTVPPWSCAGALRPYDPRNWYRRCNPQTLAGLPVGLGPQVVPAGERVGGHAIWGLLNGNCRRDEATDRPMSGCGAIGRNCVTSRAPAKFDRNGQSGLIGGKCRCRYLWGEAATGPRPSDAERFARNVAAETGWVREPPPTSRIQHVIRVGASRIGEHGSPVEPFFQFPIPCRPFPPRQRRRSDGSA